MLTFTERRRLALVAVISLIALPTILLMGNDSPKNDSSTLNYFSFTHGYPFRYFCIRSS